MIDIVKKLSVMIDRRSKQQFALLLLPMLGVGLLEMASIGMIIPVIHIVMFGGEGGTVVETVKWLIPLDIEGVAPGLIVSIVFGVLFPIKSLLLFAMIFLINRTVYRKVTRYSADMFELYLHRPLQFHLQRNSSEIIRNLTSGSSLTFEAIRHVLMIVLEALLLMSAVVLLLLVDPVVTLSLAGSLGVVTLLFYRFTLPVFRHWGQRQQALEGDTIKWIVQALSNIRDIKLFNSYRFLDRRMREIATQSARYQTLSVSTINIPRLFLETVVMVGFIILITVISATDTPREQIISTLAVFGMASMRILPSLNRILSSGAELGKRSAYVDVLYRDWVDGLADGESDTRRTGPAAIKFDDRLDVRQVVYAYPNTERAALNDINLSIKSGETVGFVGPSGGGKSTLMDIVLGLHEPSSGEVTVDGVNITVDPTGWRGMIGFVPQQIYLIDDSIRRNIAYGIEDEEIDDARLTEVIRLAYLEGVIDALPNGVDTVIGEHGTRMSGGQRQRVAIARALYRDPDILVFDEATSALDTVSESEVTDAIEALARSRTVLIIAHRLSTVKNCDRIVFIQNGKIADQGKFDELCSRNADFARMATIGTSGNSGTGD
jgi:ABC-type multidrug transport system fused ATPase/permease subunit